MSWLLVLVVLSSEYRPVSWWKEQSVSTLFTPRAESIPEAIWSCCSKSPVVFFTSPTRLGLACCSNLTRRRDLILLTYASTPLFRAVRSLARARRCSIPITDSQRRGIPLVHASTNTSTDGSVRVAGRRYTVCSTTQGRHAVGIGRAHSQSCQPQPILSPKDNDEIIREQLPFDLPLPIYCTC